MEKNWTEIEIRVSEVLSEAVCNRLLEEGANGVIIEDGDAFWDEEGVISRTEDGEAVVRSFFPSTALLDVRSALESYLRDLHDMHPDTPAAEVLVRDLPNDDWAHAWRKFFKPTELAPGIVVKPTWEPYKAKEGELIIEIDPGMAFGTGLHATTRLCVQAIQELATSPEYLGTPGVAHRGLDVGTGSGILAILMARLGVGRTVAIDNDPEAVSAAEENCRLNQVTEKVMVQLGTVEDLDESYHLVVANIIAEVLIDIRDALIGRVERGGYLVLSGILKEKGSDVRSHFLKGKVDFVESRNEGEWTALVFQRT